MKQTLHRFAALAMACIVLVTSTGFGLVEHSCIVKGKSVHLLATEQSCGTCKTPHTHQGTNQLVVKKASCCKEEQKYENVDVSSSLTQLVAKAAKSAFDAVIDVAVQFVRSIVEAFVSPEPDTHSSSAHSLLYGRTLLAFVQSFLI
jgi:hypothetical protein